MEITGTVADGYERVRDAFERNFTDHGEIGAGCCVYVDGQAVVDLYGGTLTANSDDTAEPYGPQTLQLVASATKGAMAILAHRLVQRGELDLDAPVASYWPEFAANGKETIPVRWLLSHQAGLPVVDGSVTLDDIVDWDAVVAKVAATAPVWEPGTTHGYHAITYGWLIGEVLRRITGKAPGRLLADDLATPLGLDLHVGTPEAEQQRLSPLHPAPRAAHPDEITARLLDPTTLAHRAFLISEGLLGWFNDPRLLAAELPAGNGTATAHALARMYAACVGEVDGRAGTRLLDDDTLAAARVEQARGDDTVLGYETAFALGFQRTSPFRPMAGEGSFGHYGLGGSVGFADTDYGFAFGYTVNQMGPGTPADPRSEALIAALIASR